MDAVVVFISTVQLFTLGVLIKNSVSIARLCVKLEAHLDNYEHAKDV